VADCHVQRFDSTYPDFRRLRCYGYPLQDKAARKPKVRPRRTIHDLGRNPRRIRDIIHSRCAWTDLMFARSQMAMSPGVHIVFGCHRNSRFHLPSSWCKLTPYCPITERSYASRPGAKVGQGRPDFSSPVGAVSGTALSSSVGLLWPRYSWRRWARRRRHAIRQFEAANRILSSSNIRSAL